MWPPGISSTSPDLHRQQVSVRRQTWSVESDTAGLIILMDRGASTAVRTAAGLLSLSASVFYSFILILFLRENKTHNSHSRRISSECIQFFKSSHAEIHQQISQHWIKTTYLMGQKILLLEQQLQSSVRWATDGSLRLEGLLSIARRMRVGHRSLPAPV